MARFSLHNLSIARRQWLLVIIILLLTTAGGLFTLWQFSQTRRKVDEIATNWLPSITLSGRMRRDISEFRRYQIQIILAKDPAQYAEFRGLLDSAAERLEQEIQEYKRLETEIDGLPYRQFVRRWRQYWDDHKEFMAVVERSRRSEGAYNQQELVSFINGEKRGAFLRAFADLTALIAINSKGAEAAAAQVRQMQETTTLLGAMVIGLTFVLSIGFAWTIVRSIAKPARELEQAAGKVARNDYGVHIPDYGNNELGRLADAFRIMTAALGQNDALQKGLAALNVTLAGDKNNAELGQDILSFFAERMNLHAAALYTLHPDRKALRLTASFAMSVKPSERTTPEVAFGEGIVGQAAQDQRIMSVDDIPAENIRHNSRLVGDILPRYIVAVPFVYHNEFVGVVEMWKLRPFTQEQRTFLSLSVEPIAVALQTAKNKAAMLEQNLTLATANEEIQRQMTVQAEQQQEIELANSRLQENMLEIAVAKEEIEKQVEVQAIQQQQLERAYIEMEEKNILLASAKEEVDKQMEEQVAQQRVLEKSMMQLQETNWQLVETKEELQRQAAIQDAQAVEIEIANTMLQEKNLQIEHTLKQLQTAQQQIVQSEKMAGLGQLTAGVAHEINNPVTFISGAVKPLQRNINDMLEVLQEFEKLTPATDPAMANVIIERAQKLRREAELDEVVSETKELIKSMDNGAQRIAEIVKGLRNFSRLDEQDIKTVDLHEGVDSTLTILRSQYKDRIEIVKNYGSLPLVECYAGQLNQVFMNVLSNGIQAIDGAGSIWITTSVQKNAHGADVVVLSFKDSGKGMTEDVKKHIFEPFFTTKDVGKGTGLGLSISFGVIEKHNGTITVNSSLGAGSEFILTLPVAQAAS